MPLRSNHGQLLVWPYCSPDYDRGVTRARRRAALVRQFFLACVVVGLTLPSASAIAAGRARVVLVIYDSSRLLPAAIEGDRGLLESFSGSEPTTDVSYEFLDYPSFDTERFRRAYITFLNEKYALRPPEVIVAGGSRALDFLLRNRTELFPVAPIVHLGVPEPFLRAKRPLPADVVGVSVDYDFS